MCLERSLLHPKVFHNKRDIENKRKLNRNTVYSSIILTFYHKCRSEYRYYCPVGMHLPVDALVDGSNSWLLSIAPSFPFGMHFFQSCIYWYCCSATYRYICIPIISLSLCIPFVPKKLWMLRCAFWALTSKQNVCDNICLSIRCRSINLINNVVSYL
jgi:hypothetical protein